MKDRLQSINRVLGFQKQLQRLAEWKLIALQRQEADLEERQRDLVRFLDEDTPFSGLFAATLMKRVRGVSEARMRLASERAAQEARLLEEMQRVGRAERLTESLERDRRRTTERQELAEAIEVETSRGRASLP